VVPLDVLMQPPAVSEAAAIAEGFPDALCAAAGHHPLRLVLDGLDMLAEALHYTIWGYVVHCIIPYGAMWRIAL